MSLCERRSSAFPAHTWDRKIDCDCPDSQANQEGREMVFASSGKAAIFVDRARPHHWIVRDPDGNYWIVPPVEDAWECRSPFEITEETELEMIPGHYLGTLGLPF
jgi:hypothetical protein